MLPISNDSFCEVLTNFVKKNRSGYDRVENIEFWVNICQLNKEIRRWVLWSEWGPYKLSKTRVVECLPESPQMLRCFLGALNREKIALVESAFLYLISPDDHPEKSVLAALSPLVTNFKGESLLDIAIAKMLEGKSFEGILKLFFNQLSPTVFFSSLKKFEKDFDSTHLIRLIELFFDKPEPSLPREVLQWIYVLLRYSTNGELFIKWAQNKGIRFDIEILSSCCSDLGMYEERQLSHLMQILEFHPEIMFQPNSKGQCLIHLLLNGNKETWIVHQYLESILNKYPESLKAKDGDGRSAIYYILIDGRDILSRIGYEHDTSEFYWEVREDVFEAVLNYPKRWGWYFHIGNCCDLAIAWNRIFKRFSEKEHFEKWLTLPYGKDQKSFMHELIIRSHYLAGVLFKYVEEKKEDIAIIQGNDYEAIKEQFIKYPGLKDFFHWDLWNQLFSPVNRANVLSKLDALFDFGWINYQQENGDTALHRNFSRSCSKLKLEAVAIIIYMMDRGFDPEVKNKAGKSVLDLIEEYQWNDYIHLFQ